MMTTYLGTNAELYLEVGSSLVDTMLAAVRHLYETLYLSKRLARQQMNNKHGCLTGSSLSGCTTNSSTFERECFLHAQVWPTPRDGYDPCKKVYNLIYEWSACGSTSPEIFNVFQILNQLCVCLFKDGRALARRAVTALTGDDVNELELAKVFKVKAQFWII